MAFLQTDQRGGKRIHRFAVIREQALGQANVAGLGYVFVNVRLFVGLVEKLPVPW
ncbi:MAG: hypothetical protein HKN28_07560 [Alphaproteobacteria bacterium]|nr:hypothetical protein [Alphaproteobacteria bacterium]